jgi:hypothetical protein
MNVSKDSMWRRIYCFLWNILKPKRSLQIVKSDRLQFFLRGHRAREGEKRERPGTYSAQLHIACCRRRQQRRRETERSWDESGSKATAPETRGEESEICVVWGHCSAAALSCHRQRGPRPPVDVSESNRGQRGPLDPRCRVQLRPACTMGCV